MSSLKEINNKVYIDDDLLLDFRNPLANFSRLPLYQSEPELKSLFWTLVSLISDGQNEE